MQMETTKDIVCFVQYPLFIGSELGELI